MRIDAWALSKAGDNRFRVVAASSLIGLAGCASGEDGPSVIRSDSAGVKIVESSAAAWQADERWRLEGPRVSIGSSDGAPETQLHRVRAVGVMPDGRIAVGNAGSSEIRVYGPDGRWVRSIGREGDGPGEFRLISRLQVLSPDTIIIFDDSGPRVTVFTADGTLVESRRVAAPTEAVQAPDYRLPDRRWLNLIRSQEVEGYQKRRNSFVVWSEAGPAMDTVLARDGQEYLIYVRHQGGQYVGRGAVVVPFGGQDLTAVGPGRLALSDGKIPDIAVSEIGGSDMRIRRTGPRQPLPGGAVSRFVEDYVARYPRQRQPEVRGHFAQLPASDQTPAHSALMFDRSGNLWAENYRFPWDTLSHRTWSVFAASGELLGDVEFPKGLRVFEIGEDFVAGVERDGDGVEYVRIYRLIKPD